MAQAKSGDTVKVDYTGKLDDGSIFDASEGREPLQFTLGAGELIPGFEQAVLGMDVGETKTVKIASDEAYGPYRDDMRMDVPRDKFPTDITPELGQQLQLRNTDGSSLVVTVTEISDANVTIDANHPLAGKDLTFEIQLVEIL